MTPTKRVRCWCITEHNTKYYKIWKSTPKHEALRYLTYQLELTKTGKLHIQGYVESYERVSMKRLKELLGSTSLHIEPRQGTRKEARDYCHKDDSPWFRINYPQWSTHGGRVEGTDVVELGTWDTKQGNRSDLDRVYDMINCGATEEEILDKCPREYIKYHSGITRARHVRTLKLAGKYIKVTVRVLYGNSRTGKTRHVMDTHGHENVYKPVWNGQKYWFTDYDGEEVLLLDEFYGQIRPSSIQQLLDNYHLRLEAKGSNPISQWKYIYITSNVHPEEWWNGYRNIPDEVQQSIINRICSVTYFPDKIDLKSKKKTWRTITVTKKEVDSPSITYPLPVHFQNTEPSNLLFPFDGSSPKTEAWKGQGSTGSREEGEMEATKTRSGHCPKDSPRDCKERRHEKQAEVRTRSVYQEVRLRMAPLPYSNSSSDRLATEHRRWCPL